MTAALGPLFGEVAGLPGAPGSAVQVAANYVGRLDVQASGPGRA